MVLILSLLRKLVKVIGMTILVLSPLLIGIELGLSHVNNLPLAKAPYSYFVGLDPTNSMYVAWESDSAIPSAVQYGLRSNTLDNILINSTLTTFHRFLLTGLVPGQRYYYQVGYLTKTGTFVGTSSIHSFNTAPLVGTFNFTGTGDSQQKFGVGHYDSIANAMDQLGPSAFSINVGDFCPDGDDQPMWNYYFNMSTFLRHTPLVPCPGDNDDAHKESSLYLKYFGTTVGNHGVYYSFNWSNTQFVVAQIADSGDLHQDTPEQLAMFQWLNQTLDNGQAQTFRVLIFHRNVFWSDYNMKVIVPIVEHYNVSLVLYGHYHTYRRYLYNNHTYICIGNGGTIQANLFGQDHEEDNVMARVNGASFTQFFVNETSIHIITRNPYLEILDEITILGSSTGMKMSTQYNVFSGNSYSISNQSLISLYGKK